MARDIWAVGKREIITIEIVTSSQHVLARKVSVGLDFEILGI